MTEQRQQGSGGIEPPVVSLATAGSPPPGADSPVELSDLTGQDPVDAIGEMIGVPGLSAVETLLMAAEQISENSKAARAAEEEDDLWSRQRRGKRRDDGGTPLSKRYRGGN